MALPDEIEIRSDVMFGKACLKGTRIPVSLILEKLGGGETVADILEAYPQLTAEHLLAALRYAAMLASDNGRRKRARPSCMPDPARLDGTRR